MIGVIVPIDVLILFSLTTCFGKLVYWFSFCYLCHLFFFCDKGRCGSQTKLWLPSLTHDRDGVIQKRSYTVYHQGKLCVFPMTQGQMLYQLLMWLLQYTKTNIFTVTSFSLAVIQMSARWAMWK